jgi:hypothetical protein
MPALFLGLLKSRTACAVLAVLAVFLGLWVWHTLDKSSAVRRAVAGYVAEAEIKALQAQLREAQHRSAVVLAANRHLNEKIAATEQAAAQEIAAYVSTVDDNCRVDPGLSDRLRNR